MTYRVIYLVLFLLGLASTVKAQDRKMKIYSTRFVLFRVFREIRGSVF